jgi:hypothetical protein
VWRLDQAVFGRRKAVNLFAAVVAFAHSSSANDSSLSLGTPSFSDANGMQVWLLRAEELKVLRERFKQTPGTEVINQARMSTADQIRTGMFAGQSIPLNGSTNEVGLRMDCFARVRPDSTDLIASITLSELMSNPPAGSSGSSLVSVVSIQTNLDAAFRVQIPKRSGVFLLDVFPAGSSRKRIGLIIDPP